MVSVVGLGSLLVLLALHTLAAAIMTRYFRVVLDTRWGWIFYTLFLVPVALLASTLFFTGALGFGIDLGSPTMVIVVLIALPLAVGLAIDVLYVPPPEDVQLPEPRE